MRCILALLLAAVCLPGASGTPDLSGTWELNVSRSDYAWQRPPRTLTQFIRHKEPQLKVETYHVEEDGSEVRGTADYTTDGKECTVKVMGNDLKATAVWDGPALVITTTGAFGGDPIKLVDRWQLDGKVLTVFRHFEGHGRKADQKLVYEKQ